MNIQAPYFQEKKSNLGGNETTFVYVSLDSPETWANGIFHNSRYLIIQFDGESAECISKHYKLPTFRKSSRVKSINQLVDYINKYIVKCSK